MGRRDIGTVPMRPQGNPDRATKGKRKKGKKKVISVSQSVGIIHAHIKQCAYMVLYYALQGITKGKKPKYTTPFFKKKSIPANGGD